MHVCGRPAKSLADLKEDFIPSEWYRSSTFNATTKMPGAANNTLRRVVTNCQNGDIWEWQATLIKTAHYIKPDAEILALERKTDSIIKKCHH